MKKIIFLLIIFTVLIFAACQSAITDVPTASVPPSTSETSVNEVTPAEAKTAIEKGDAQFIDVRDEAEYQGGHAPNAVNFPLDTLAQNLDKLDKTKPVYVICQTGRRSEIGAEILNKNGFEHVYSIGGGTSAWTAAGLPIENISKTSKSKLDEKTEKALLAALADERQAQATYEAVIAKFGNARPFSNIVNAEKRHESILLPLFEKYGVELPKNEFNKDKAQVPATLTEACQNAVKGERANIALYDGFLEFVKESDIREVFVYLRDASQTIICPLLNAVRKAEEWGAGELNLLVWKMDDFYWLIGFVVIWLLLQLVILPKFGVST